MEVYDDGENEEGSPANGPDVHISAGGQGVTIVDEEATPEVMEAARILMSMRQSQMSSGESLPQNQFRQYHDQDVEAAKALETLRRSEAMPNTTPVGIQQTTTGGPSELSERNSIGPGSFTQASGTKDDPLVVSSGDEPEVDERDDEGGLH
jgi:hypothetical protein